MDKSLSRRDRTAGVPMDLFVDLSSLDISVYWLVAGMFFVVLLCLLVLDETQDIKDRVIYQNIKPAWMRVLLKLALLAGTSYIWMYALLAAFALAVVVLASIAFGAIRSHISRGMREPRHPFHRWGS